MKTYLYIKGTEVILVRADTKKQAIGYLKHSGIQAEAKDLYEYVRSENDTREFKDILVDYVRETTRLRLPENN